MMSDGELKVYSQKLDQELQQKKMTLLNAIRDKVNAAIKEVADSKGITMVITKSVNIYGGRYYGRCTEKNNRSIK